MGNGLGGGTNKKFREVHVIKICIFIPHHQVLDLNFFASTSVMHFSQRVEGTLGHYRWNLLGSHEGLVLVLGVFSEKSLGDTLGTAGGRHLWGDHLVRAYQAVGYLHLKSEDIAICLVSL